MPRLRSTLAVVGVLGTLAAASVAWATAPGENGKLVFRRYLDERRTTGALFTSNADGTGVRQITGPGKTGLDNEPDWSPDGRRIVYEHSTGPRDERIFIVNADGTGPRPVVACTGGCAGQEAPAWSPDGREIAFASGGVRYEQIWIVGVDGMNLRRLTRLNGLDADPQWSPDGRRIVFRRIDPYRARKGYALFVVNVDGSGERRLTPWALRAGDHPDWSPDGKRILFRANVEGPKTISSNLHTVRPDGSGLTQLTHARRGDVQHLSAGFSPDGKWIVFSRTPGSGADGNADVFVMRSNGTGVRNVTRSAVWDSAVDWGPR
jgi:TolB protein